MIGNRHLRLENAQLKEQIAKLEDALHGAQKINAALIEDFSQVAALTAIDIRGGNNIFTIQKDGVVFYIETYHMMQDKVDLWKKQAGIET